MSTLCLSGEGGGGGRGRVEAGSGGGGEAAGYYCVSWLELSLF